MRAHSESQRSLRGQMRNKDSQSVIASSVCTPMTNVSHSSRMSTTMSHFADYVHMSNPNP